mgnify:CR=1 FL=1
MEKKDTFFIIPARRDSKGLPFKNRKLLDYTINNIPTELHEKTIVTTNDEEIIKRLSSTKINVLKRDEKLCLDDVNIRDVMEDVANEFHMNSEDTIYCYECRGYFPVSQAASHQTEPPSE